MKNTIMIDLDSERENPIVLTKPENMVEDLEDVEKAKQMVLEDMTTVCNALGTLIKVANDNGYMDAETSAKMCVEYLNENFLKE